MCLLSVRDRLSQASSSALVPSRRPRQFRRNGAVSETLRAFDKKQAVLVPGTLTTRIQAFAHRVLPRAVVARIAASVSTKIMTTGAK